MSPFLADAEPQYRSVPNRRGEIDLLDVLGERMLADRPAPERQATDVPACDRRFPHPWIATEDRLCGGGSRAAAPMLSQHEELRHVAVERPIRVRQAIEECETDDVRAHAQQQRYVVGFAPIGIQRVGGEAALLVDLARRQSYHCSEKSCV